MSKKFAVILIAGCLVLANVAATAQRSKAIKVADKFTRSLCLYAYSGFGDDHICKACSLQHKLAETATNDELADLALCHSKASVRAFAFYCLAERKDARCREILCTSLHDTACFGVIDPIFSGTFMYVLDFETKGIRTFLNENDSIWLDSLLFFTPDLPPLAVLYSIIRNQPLDSISYLRLHEMYYQEHNVEALTPLCRYHKEEEKRVVLKLLAAYHKEEGIDEPTKCGMKAVTVWPDKDFIPSLLKIRDYETSGTKSPSYDRMFHLFNALMAYDDEYSYRIIDETLSAAAGTKYTHDVCMGFLSAYDLKHSLFPDNAPRTRYAPLAEKYGRTGKP